MNRCTKQQIRLVKKIKLCKIFYGIPMRLIYNYEILMKKIKSEIDKTVAESDSSGNLLM